MASGRSRAPSVSPPPSTRGPSRPRSRSQHRNDDHSPSRQRRRRSRHYDRSGYEQPREKYAPNKIDLLFCVFSSATSSSWRTVPYTFDRRRINDNELWEDIRAIYRNELETLWRRALLFKRLKFIAPITYTRNDVPIRVEKKDLPNKHTFMHAYHHPQHIHADSEWVEFFTRLADKNPNVSVGLEFVEGLWAEKLAFLAVLLTIAIVVVSIVWCVRGGNLQTVFTVMSFVLTLVAAEIALITLYYQPRPLPKAQPETKVKSRALVMQYDVTGLDSIECRALPGKKTTAFLLKVKSHPSVKRPNIMIKKVDVTISGGGPVGLLIAYCLASAGVSTFVVEQQEEEKHAYGRAAMLAPRSVEMLEQLGLAEELIQMGFASRGQRTFKNGEQIDAVTYASSNFDGTYHDYLLMIRQQFIEEVIRHGYRSCGGGSVQWETRLVDFEVKEFDEEYPVVSTFESKSGATFQVASKYLVGADGSRSRVREVAEISTEGDKNNQHFIRVDGKIKTDLPDPRKGLVSIDSVSHGSILWACLDHGITRIGFLFPETLYQSLGAEISKEIVIQEAKKAVQPFNLEFETVEWWTAYSVGQRLASKFRAHDRVFIAGDAAHSISSAAAQGLNVGVHDAVNLSWKLAGQLKGRYQPTVLESYTSERRSHALKIIEQDRLVSRLHAGQVPEYLRHDPTIDRQKLMNDTYRSNQQMNIGIGIAYEATNPTLVPFSNDKVSAGQRAPDVLLQKPHSHLPLRLLTLFKNIGRFTIVVFTGDSSVTAHLVQDLRRLLDGSDSFTHLTIELLHFMTVILTDNDQRTIEDKLGCEPFGYGYYDSDGEAHRRYGADSDQGMLFILRPDGTIGTGCGLSEGQKIYDYFNGFLTTSVMADDKRLGKSKVEKPSDSLGEVEIQSSA